MKFWVIERKKTVTDESGDEDTWQERVYNLPDTTVLVDHGIRLKVDTADEIALRMMVSDQCSIERA
jgi:hypothetical protein